MASSSTPIDARRKLEDILRTHSYSRHDDDFGYGYGSSSSLSEESAQRLRDGWNEWRMASPGSAPVIIWILHHHYSLSPTNDKKGRHQSTSDDDDHDDDDDDDHDHDGEGDDDDCHTNTSTVSGKSTKEKHDDLYRDDDRALSWSDLKGDDRVLADQLRAYNRSSVHHGHATTNNSAPSPSSTKAAAAGKCMDGKTASAAKPTKQLSGTQAQTVLDDDGATATAATGDQRLELRLHRIRSVSYEEGWGDDHDHMAIRLLGGSPLAPGQLDLKRLVIYNDSCLSPSHNMIANPTRANTRTNYDKTHSNCTCNNGRGHETSHVYLGAAIVMWRRCDTASFALGLDLPASIKDFIARGHQHRSSHRHGKKHHRMTAATPAPTVTLSVGDSDHDVIVIAAMIITKLVGRGSYYESKNSDHDERRYEELDKMIPQLIERLCDSTFVGDGNDAHTPSSSGMSNGVPGSLPAIILSCVPVKAIANVILQYLPSSGVYGTGLLLIKRLVHGLEAQNKFDAYLVGYLKEHVASVCGWRSLMPTLLTKVGSVRVFLDTMYPITDDSILVTSVSEVYESLHIAVHMFDHFVKLCVTLPFLPDAYDNTLQWFFRFGHILLRDCALQSNASLSTSTSSINGELPLLSSFVTMIEHGLSLLTDHMITHAMEPISEQLTRTVQSPDISSASSSSANPVVVLSAALVAHTPEYYRRLIAGAIAHMGTRVIDDERSVAYHTGVTWSLPRTDSYLRRYHAAAAARQTAACACAYCVELRAFFDSPTQVEVTYDRGGGDPNSDRLKHFKAEHSLVLYSARRYLRVLTVSQSRAPVLKLTKQRRSDEEHTSYVQQQRKVIEERLHQLKQLLAALPSPSPTVASPSPSSAAGSSVKRECALTSAPAS